MKNINNDLIHRSPNYEDERGSLVVWENNNLPFVPARTFLISNVPEGQTRANHSVSCDLLITAVSGSVKVILNNSNVILLDDKTEGLFVQKNTFIILKDFSENAAVLVFAKESYDKIVYSNQ